MFEAIEIAQKVVDRESLKFEGKQVVDAQFKSGEPLTTDQLRLLTMMNEIQDLV